MDALTRLAKMFVLFMASVMMLFYWCNPATVDKRINSLATLYQDALEPYALFLKWFLGITLTSFLLSYVCVLLAERFNWPSLLAFGDRCRLFCLMCSILLPFTVASIVKEFEIKMNEEEKQKQINNYQTNNINAGPNSTVATAAFNSSVHVSAGNSILVQRHIHSLIDDVSNSGEYLTPHQKNTAIENLNVLADQAMRTTAEREQSKLKKALTLLPGILSSTTALAEAWAKLEPLIKASFHHP